MNKDLTMRGSVTSCQAATSCGDVGFAAPLAAALSEGQG
jgi:hypothetical protein